AQGVAAGGMAGIKLAAGASVIFFGAATLADSALPADTADTADTAPPEDTPTPDGASAEGGAESASAEPLVVTVSAPTNALPGTDPGRAKVTPLREFPAKGRATGGVRAHAFLKGEDALTLAWVGPAPALAVASDGAVRTLPDSGAKRDAS